MIMTYDFALMAQRDSSLKEEIESALKSDIDCIVCTNIHRMHFQSEKKTVIVESLSENSDFHMKIVPKEITYEAVAKMINGDWSNLDEENVRDVECYKL